MSRHSLEMPENKQLIQSVRLETPLIDIHDALTFQQAVNHLCSIDVALAGVVERHGPPPRWQRPQGFASLLYIILEQQVSLASARAVWRKMAAVVAEVTPETFLFLSDAQLQAFGFSRQKLNYGRILATAIQNGTLDMSSLAQLDDAAAKAELMRLKGIGHWTSDIYLIEALGRSDILPVGDLALVVAAQQVYELAARPTAPELLTLAEHWRPWRSVAVHILWWHYLRRGGGNFTPPSDAYQPPGT